MPTYSFDTTINPGDTGQTAWASAVSAALNELGPLVGDLPVFLGNSAPTPTKYLWFKTIGGGAVELWIRDS